MAAVDRGFNATLHRYYAKAQTEFKPKLLAQDNVFLQDIFTRFVAIGMRYSEQLLTERHSEKNDPEHPVSCGLYRLEKGQSLEYTYSKAKSNVHAILYSMHLTHP